MFNFQIFRAKVASEIWLLQCQKNSLQALCALSFTQSRFAISPP
ncbi:Uncharacterised protein [Vibrio cholerae]|nr:Uncharacterised protein [Vibrio cholerae]